MISRELATVLTPLLSWIPQNGDRFFIPRPEIADSVFTVSDMVVEMVTHFGETRFHFNGTVEWALDSVESDAVVWLPREDQLRDLLGSWFLSLDASAGGFVVTVSGPSRAHHTAAGGRRGRRVRPGAALRPGAARVVAGAGGHGPTTG